MNQQEHDLITPLVEAANAVVEGARKAASQVGQSISDLRVPIIVGGTDLRIIVEAGPKTAAANAVEIAVAKAGGKPTMRRDDAVRAAADIISVMATELKAAHTLRGEWGTDIVAKMSHDEMLTVVDALNRGAA